MILRLGRALDGAARAAVADPFVPALLLTLVVLAGALLCWREGSWQFSAFAMQMCLIFCAGIFGGMRRSGLIAVVAGWVASMSTALTPPLAAFVPPGGGQWGGQGPVVVEAAAAPRPDGPRGAGHHGLHRGAAAAARVATCRSRRGPRRRRSRPCSSR